MASHPGNSPLPTVNALQAVLANASPGVILEEAPGTGSGRGTSSQRARNCVLKAEKPLDLTPWPSRRRSDYVTALLMVNSLIGLVMMYGHQHPLILFFGAAAILSWTLGLTWIVWVVMDRY